MDVLITVRRAMLIWIALQETKRTLRMRLIRLMDVQEIYIVYSGRQLNLCGLNVEVFSFKPCCIFDCRRQLKG
jgi:hypothetical protein